MAYLRRKIDRYLMDWKKTQGHNPLIVKGPRQVGKTESIMRFAGGGLLSQAVSIA